MSIDLKFVELTAEDVREIFFIKYPGVQYSAKYIVVVTSLFYLAGMYCIRINLLVSAATYLYLEDDRSAG